MKTTDKQTLSKLKAEFDNNDPSAGLTPEGRKKIEKTLDSVKLERPFLKKHQELFNVIACPLFMPAARAFETASQALSYILDDDYPKIPPKFLKECKTLLAEVKSGLPPKELNTGSTGDPHSGSKFIMSLPPGTI